MRDSIFEIRAELLETRRRVRRIEMRVLRISAECGGDFVEGHAGCAN